MTGTPATGITASTRPNVPSEMPTAAMMSFQRTLIVANVTPKMPNCAAISQTVRG